MINIFFPRRCPVCDDVVRSSEGLICLHCRPRLKYITDPICMKCGKKLMTAVEYCHDCIGRQHMYDRGMALYDYRSIADSIYRFKYQGRREYADFYGREMGKYLGEEIKSLQSDVLLPVPIHRQRMRERGYNQASVLAKAISRELGIPVADKLMIRQRKTTPQKELDPTERQNNLKKAFKIFRNDVKLDTVTVIDDIYTTGSTIDAIAVELRRVGVRRVYFVALSIGQGNLV
ncbi:MAG: ComF family protein [Lachnospiraceae bacterium]|nr:ComF family protein [Lachnospiraceae bacterium]